jgi:hypothetical protein
MLVAKIDVQPGIAERVVDEAGFEERAHDFGSYEDQGS